MTQLGIGDPDAVDGAIKITMWSEVVGGNHMADCMVVDPLQQTSARVLLH